MYWRRGEWITLDRDEADHDKAKTIVTQLGEELGKAQGRQFSLLVYRRDASTEMGECERPITERGETTTDAFQCRLVTTVAYRAMPFYSKNKSENKPAKIDVDKDWFVYRFTCRIDPNKSDELAGYLPEAAFFAVFQPGELSTPSWTLLDWTSTPLHWLNYKAGLKPAALSYDHLIDYLEFFISYLGSSEDRSGLIHPFIIPSTGDEIFAPSSEAGKWAPSDEGEMFPAPPGFEEFAASNDFMLFEANDFTGNNDSFDLPEEVKPPPKPESARPKLIKNPRDIVKKFFEEKRRNWFEKPAEHPEKSSAEQQKKPLQFTAPITYNGALFEATFSLDDNGMVLMVDNDPASGADWLPAPRWEVRRRPDGINLLCLQTLRRERSVKELQREISVKELDKKLKSDRPIVVPNTRVSEPIGEPRTIKNTLIFYDVEFMEEVVLDDWIFERSLEFHRCRFMKTFSLRNATVNGSLSLDGSQIEGAVKKSPSGSQETIRHAHALDLRGLKVERLLSFDRLTVYGQLDGKGLRAANAVYGRGLRVSLRKDNNGRDIDDSKRPALDFYHASISGPLVLEAHDDSKSHRPDPFRRTIVSGAVSFEGLSAKEVKADGMVVGGNLDCKFSDILGGIWLMPFFRTSINWRAFVYGFLHLDHAHVGVLYLDGSLITGSICMVEMRARSLYARGCFYRSWIGGDFQASGAVIDNVIEVEGAKVGGELRFITGKCGRLTLSVYPWWKDEKTPILTPCEAQGITILNFTIDRSVRCVGLRLMPNEPHSTWSEGGILTQDLHIGGSLLFWDPQQSTRLRQRLLSDWIGDSAKRNPENEIGAEIKKILANISGSINLEGAHVEGAVNLCRTKVAGSIDLANAHVGGSLVTFHESTDPYPYPCLDCTELNARNIQVGDDADLRGLKVRMNGQNTGAVNFEGAHVDGILYLGRTEIEGTINLMNTRVGDSLMAFDKDFYQHSLTCTGLNARNMQVGGDVDLRDLRVFKGGLNLGTDGNIELQDVKVAGILSLATPPRTKGAWWNFEPSVLVKDGRIDLTGAHASQIILSGKSIDSDCIEHGFELARCKVGQLTIGGFVEKDEGYFYNKNIFNIFNLPYSQNYRFPRKIDLSAIEVGDWDVNAQTEAAGLLEASHPFDARVYLDLENRLSRQGYIHRANDVYRSMADRTRDNLWRGLRGWPIAIGSKFNWAFSGNGTLLLPMVSLLIFSIILTACLLTFPANIESVEKNPPYTHEFLAENWNFGKAFGLAFSYAVPIYKSASDIAKARLVGQTCLGNAKSHGNSIEGEAPMDKGIWIRVFEFRPIEIPLLNNSYERTQLETLSNSIDALKTSAKKEKTSVTECETRLLSWSPHDLAQAVSFGQLLLWLFLAGNLPSIMRKRG